MATVKICNIDSTFLPSIITSARYKLVDISNGNIVDSGVVSLPDDIYTWKSSLDDGAGGAYRTLHMMAYVKFYYAKSETEWIEIGSYNQNELPNAVWACDGNSIKNINI